MSLMCSSLCFNRGLMGSDFGLKCGLQANSLNGVVHGGVTFLLGLMGSNFGLEGGLMGRMGSLKGGLQVSFMSLMCRSLGFDRGLQASPRNSVVHGGVTFLLRMVSLMRLSLGRLMSLMRRNLGMNRGLQASLMSLVCSLMCSLMRR